MHVVKTIVYDVTRIRIGLLLKLCELNGGIPTVFRDCDFDMYGTCEALLPMDVFPQHARDYTNRKMVYIYRKVQCNLQVNRGSTDAGTD